MSSDRGLDGRRIGELLSSELSAREDGPLASLSVGDPVSDAEPSVDGTFAYAIEAAGERIGAVYLQPDRVRVEFRTAPETVRATAAEQELRVRPRSDPPGVIVFVADGADVKRVLPVVEAALS